MFKSTQAGVEIDVRVIPRASKTQLAGDRDGRLVVRLAAPPVEGAANDALIKFFSELLDVPRRAVRLVSGERGRNKRIAVAGIAADVARARLLPPRSAG